MTATGDLARYRIIAKLGSGGMATVDLAEDTLLGRRVALKRMSGEADVAGLTRLRREALVGASFSHINLVSVYDVLTTDDGHLVIVMEYVEGPTLREVLTRRGRLPVHEALPILGGVAAGLDAINQRGIVHRDVKPSNILLGGGGAAATVKLADLGIAAAPDRTRITSSGAVIGSLSYMAPEQLSDAPVTRAIDVYALAAVTFEVLSGVKARREGNAVALAHAISTQDPPRLRTAWPEAPRGLERVLQRAMARDPRQRPRSAGELMARVRAAIEPEDTAVLRTERIAEPPVRSAPIVAGRRPLGPRPAVSPPRDRPRRSLAPDPPVPPPRDRPRRGVVAAALLGLAVAAGALVAVLTSGGSSGHRPATAASTGRAHHRPTHAGASAGSATITSSGTAAGRSSTATATSSTAAANSSTAAAGSSTAAASSSAAISSSSRTSSTPAAATSTASVPPATAGDPVSAVKRFYTLAAAHQYAAAWELADPAMQRQLGGYRSFQAGQAADRSITFTSARTVSQTPSSARVVITTTSVRATGTQHCAGTVDLVPGTAAGHWQLHQIGINCR